MKYYLIAGEASGDLHGAGLIRALHEADPEAKIRCWGGEKMEAAGAVLVKHYRDLAFMGFAEVVRHLGTILDNLRFCKEDILGSAPDVLVLIDYPGFNLRIAKWAKARGIRVVYYISPQVWAWKESRVEDIRRDVDLMLVILPFEKEFYARHGMDVQYVGHPLTETIRAHRAEPDTLSFSELPVVALLPGSRKQEISRKLPIMLEIVSSFPDHRFIVAMAPGIEDDYYQSLTQGRNVGLARNTYHLLRESKAALVTSGTATLETALFGVPEIVCYRSTWLTYQMARRLIRVPYISLVNLILGKEVIRELIQDQLNKTTLEAELRRILYDSDYRRQMLDEYRLLDQLLGEKPASREAARAILRLLQPA